MQIQKNVSLKPFNSWKVGGAAESYCAPTTLEELRECLTWAYQNKTEVTVLGGGTNCLISDNGIPGLVIHLYKLSGVTSREENQKLYIEAFAGTAKSELLKIFLKAKLAPALFLAGLPGDVGGGVVMNAGVGEQITPREFVEITDWVEVLKFDGTLQRFEKKQLSWSYRHCEGWRPGIVVRVGLSWPIQPQPEILQEVKAANQLRLKKQPLEWPSCGSVFVNPPGGKSGQLIEQCGLKGFSIGDAQVSEKHGNFIINKGQATAQQLEQVIQHVQKTVLDKTGFVLKTEVVRLGR